MQNFVRLNGSMATPERFVVADDTGKNFTTPMTTGNVDCIDRLSR